LDSATVFGLLFFMLVLAPLGPPYWALGKLIDWLSK
jgi:hypothetical protein